MKPWEARLQVTSRLDQVILLALAVRVWGQHAGLSHRQLQRLETCTVEAVNNAILHAYNRREAEPVEVTVQYRPGALTVRVRDQGQALDNLAVPVAAPPIDAESGRGWWIIHQWMDDVQYQSTVEGNTLSMTLRLSG